MQGRRRIVVFTDAALAHRDAVASASLPVSVIQVGAPIENAAVIRIDVRAGIDPITRNQQVQVFCVVGNFGERQRDLFVTLRQHAVVEPLASRRLLLAPGERAPLVLTFEPTAADVGAGLIVELSPPDALPADDRAYGRVPFGKSLPVVMAPEGGNRWIKRALLADPDVQLVTTSVAALPKAELRTDAFVVVDGACPTTLPGGNLLVLNPPPGRCRSALVGSQVKRPTITSWNRRDERLRFLTLDGVELLSARPLELKHRGDSLVRAREGTIISDISDPGRAGTLLSFDVGDSNWPLRASFVLFVRNLVEQARRHRERGLAGPARTGEPLRVRVPVDVDQVAVVPPGSKPSQVPARAGLVVLPNVSDAGLYHLSWQGSRPGSVLVAANLTSAAESDTRPRPQRREPHVTAAAPPRELESHAPWGWVLAAFALALIAFDAWWLTHRPDPRLLLRGAVPRLPERGSARGTTA